MFEVKYTTRFKKDYKLLKKRGYDMNKLLDVIDILREGSELPPQYKDHPLYGDYEGHRDEVMRRLFAMCDVAEKGGVLLCNENE